MDRYDFRRGLDEQEEFMANLTKLVIETYEQNNQTKVVLLTHSMGGKLFFRIIKVRKEHSLGPFALYWLHHQTSDFKNKYIRSMVNLAAPWGGAIKALRLMASGDNIDVR
jgi:surfactin synthase thioesterase subunit